MLQRNTDLLGHVAKLLDPMGATDTQLEIIKMNMIEKQTELGKTIFQINASSLKETFSLQRENVETYIATNREFGSRFPEVKNISSFISLQRDYNETLWNNAVTNFKAQSQIVRSAFEDTGVAVKSAFIAENAVADENTVVASEAAPTNEAAAPKKVVAEKAETKEEIVAAAVKPKAKTKAKAKTATKTATKK